ncbi:MAG: FecR family protein [Deltaproteobacteria bacterium]|nr:FecR family protein [Deltaproteobacteria bacterium]
MKARIDSRHIALLVGAISLATLASVSITSAFAADEPAAAPAVEAAGEVTFREGRAFRYFGKDQKKALKKGESVFAGDKVKTIGNSKLEIKLGDGSMVRLGPKSEATIKEAAFIDGGRKVSVGLSLGKAWTKVTKAFGADSKYEITTDNAVAGVRGTTFRVNANKDKSTLVRVYNGAVAVAGMRPMYQTHETGEKRQEVAGPQQVSKDQWEKLVGEMMSIKIGANGLPAEPEEFAAADEAKSAEAAWVAWNQKRDAALAGE